ncbi:MAG: hypothetical protein KA408_09990 [Flavobacteriales bacterium]|nr:hypothetical protein [Flavobacteriales bacterium]
MRTSFLFAASLSISSIAPAQQLSLQWAQAAAKGIESVQFAENGDLFALSYGGNSVLLQRYSTTGVLLWTRTLSAPTLTALDMDVDASDNIYVYLGLTTGQLDLDPGPLTTLVDPGKIYAKYNSSGQFQWGLSVESLTDLSDSYGGISCDDEGNLYITGDLGTGTYDMDPGPDVFNLVVPDFSTGSFIARYRANGTLHWADVKAWNAGFSNSRDIAALRNGSGFYVTQKLDNGGPLSSQIDVDPGPGVFNVFTETQNLLRYDSSFAFVAHANIGYGDQRLAADNNDQAYLMAQASAGAGFWAVKYARSGQELDQVYQTSLTTTGNLRFADIVPDGQGGFLGSYSNNCDFNFVRFFKMNVSGLVDFNLFLNSGSDCTLPVGKGFDLQGGKLALGTFNGNYGVDYDPGPGVLSLPGVGSNEGALGVFDWCASAPFEPFGIDLVTSEWCLGDTITLQADAFGDASGYTWDPGDWTVLSGQGSGTAEIITAPTLINTVLLAATNACGSSVPVPLPIIATTASAQLPENEIACYTYEGILDPGPCAGCTYVWQPGGATTATLPVDIDVTTTFIVEATNGSCTVSDSMTIVIDACLGISTQDGASVVLSPVPVLRSEQLVVSGAQSADIHQLIGADGREHALDMESTGGAVHIRTNALPAGQYVLRFADGAVRTFVVQ